MEIVRYKCADIDEVVALFYNTVHTINAKDYTKAQLNAWADGSVNKAQWNASLLANYTLLAKENGVIIAFADLEGAYLNRLYTHAAYQGRGAASALCKAIEQQAMLDKANCITTHASITARKFFEKRGYKALREQEVLRHGVSLINFVMQKALGKELV